MTTVDATRLSVQEGVPLVRARWQIELLFQRWKQHGRIDAWRRAQPWRVLCAVYATVLAVLLQHWCLLLQVWADPLRSLVTAAAAVRQHASCLAAARADVARLTAALTALAGALAPAGRLNASRQHRATAHRLLDCPPPADLADRARRLLAPDQELSMAA